jgi:predicted nucleic acid-binding protein
LYQRALSEGAVGPLIFEIEVTNALRTNLRRGRIDLAERNEALSLLARMNVTVSSDQPSLTEIIALSDRHDLTTYDASYVALAQKHGALLATQDQAMARAARAEGLAVLP